MILLRASLMTGFGPPVEAVALDESLEAAGDEEGSAQSSTADTSRAGANLHNTILHHKTINVGIGWSFLVYLEEVRRPGWFGRWNSFSLPAKSLAQNIWRLSVVMAGKHLVLKITKDHACRFYTEKCYLIIRGRIHFCLERSQRALQ